ncbi:Putative pentatricopeptide repeat-containing protein [Dendrobium catenatum]|uniref:Pentatricopeptide repeat-containing protein n=1 Tax=Dendrobium catenatum TaxID=906689 RepID=A0A2I0VN31_9ASPA|nr:Putative pentatricopeptide repeat-containing protein [Dendrobium catenatum]
MDRCCEVTSRRTHTWIAPLNYVDIRCCETHLQIVCREYTRAGLVLRSDRSVERIEVTIVKIPCLNSTGNVYPTPCSQTARYNVNEGFDPRLIRHCIVNDMGVGEDKWEQFLAVVKSEYDGELNGKRSMEYSGINPDSYSCNQLLEDLCKAKQIEKVCKLFANMMEKEELEPNEITFVSIFRGCSIAGVADRGLEYFDLMKSKYGIEPWPEHYGCMVDLYGRFGRLEEATLQEENIENKVFDPGICLLQQSLFH